MPWWGWIALGALLLGAEMTLVDLELYLVFLGISALTVGLLELGGVGMPEWAQWLAFSAIAVVSMVTVRRRLYDKIHKNTPELDDPLVGESIELPEELAPGDTCRAELRGSGWTVRNVGDQTLAAGSRVRVESADGLTLSVRG